MLNAELLEYPRQPVLPVPMPMQVHDAAVWLASSVLFATNGTALDRRFVNVIGGCWHGEFE